MISSPDYNPRQLKSLPDPTPAERNSFDHDEIQAPPHSPITPPSAATPPPMPRADSSKSGSSSSPRTAPPKTVTHIPPPIIPPNFASMGGRAPLTHTAHPPVVATAQPPPLEPIDFDNNPDVIALQTAIGILLNQKKQAEADIRQLRGAKEAAMKRPMEFYKDLLGGGISQGPVKTHDDEDDDDESDEEGDVDMISEGNGTTMANGLKPSALGAKAPTKRKGKGKGKGKAKASTHNNHTRDASAAAEPPPWANLPKQQDIVRMPPINWSQYAVEGEAFDKLHNTQRTHPTLGTPAVIGAGGSYEFTGTVNPDDGQRVEGISAPFDPLRDRVEEQKPAKVPAAAPVRRGA